MSVSGADLVVDALEHEGIRFAFGIPGTHNIELYDRLAESKSVRTVLVTDEQSASFMADAVWRASGEMACVNVVPGAGLTHAMSGIAEAFMDNVPMLVLGCGIRRDTGKKYQLHDVDQLGMVRPVTKDAVLVEHGTDLYRTLREACRLARSGAPGPVFVEVPAHLYLFTHEEPSGVRLDTYEPPAPDAQALARAVGMLAAAKRPLLYVGLGAASAGSRLVALAERLHSPVASTIQGKGIFPESHPLFMWPGFGNAAPSFVRSIVNSCDATLAIGCRFGEVATGSYGLEPPVPLMHVDIDGSVFNHNYEAEVCIQSDAGLFVDAILDLLPHRQDSSDLYARIETGRRRVRTEAVTGSDASKVTPAALLRAVQNRFGPDTIFTSDSGNGTFLAMEILELDAPGHFLAPVDYSCMGYAVPAAIGAKLARPDAPVVALAGDGAFLMTGLELLTAVAEEIPVLVLVLRDRELAQIAQFQSVAMSRKTNSILGEYRLEGIARAVGAGFARISTDADIETVLDAAHKHIQNGTSVLVEVNIDYSQKTHFTQGVVRTNLGRLPWRDRLRFVSRAVGRRVSRRLR
jgi:acetolactate synthase-1/2/3 large subunit